MRRSSLTVVVTSFRCGTLPSTTGAPASSVPARIGNAEFFAPEIRTSPSRRAPPRISSLSMTGGERRRDSMRLDARLAHAQAFHDPSEASAPGSAPLLGCIGAQLERMDLAADPLPQRPVNQLMAREAALAGECVADDDGLVMAHAVRAHLRRAAGQVLLDQALDLVGIHPRSIRCRGAAHHCRTRSARS